MVFWKRIIEYIKKIFCKNNDLKLIEENTSISDEEENKFREYLKVNVIKKKKKKVETAICDGDGLGIQTKIEY